MKNTDFEKCKNLINTYDYKGLDSYLDDASNNISTEDLFKVVDYAIRKSDGMTKTESAELRLWIFEVIHVRENMQCYHLDEEYLFKNDASMFFYLDAKRNLPRFDNEVYRQFVSKYIADVDAGLAIGFDKSAYYKSDNTKVQIHVIGRNEKISLQKNRSEEYVVHIENFSGYKNGSASKNTPMVSFSFLGDTIFSVTIASERPDNGRRTYSNDKEKDVCHKIGVRLIKDFIVKYFSGKNIDNVIAKVRADRAKMLAALEISAWPDDPRRYAKNMAEYFNNLICFDAKMRIIQEKAEKIALESTGSAFLLLNGFDEELRSDASLLDKYKYLSIAVAKYYRNMVYNPYNMFIGDRTHNILAGKLNHELIGKVLARSFQPFYFTVSCEENSHLLHNFLFHSGMPKEERKIKIDSRELLLDFYFSASYDQSDEEVENSWPKQRLTNAVQLFLYTYGRNASNMSDSGVVSKKMKMNND